MKKSNQKIDEELKCGLVLPISAFDDCSEQHWVDVKSILSNVIESAGFKANLVSDADDVGIIQKRIIQNLYDNPIVVCDVSGKNPNVMFELGLRLAFDKPTIIVKDDMTDYSFDTAQIEHLEYPRDLRFNKIILFKNALKEKIEGTYKKATEDGSYTTFLKNFGKFQVAQLETKEVSREDFIIEEISELKRLVRRIDRRDNRDTMTLDRRIHNVGAAKRLRELIKAVAKANQHFSLEAHDDAGRREMYAEIAQYIIENTGVYHLFESSEDFYRQLHDLIS